MKARKMVASCLLMVGIAAGAWAGNELFISDIHADTANQALVDEFEQQILAKPMPQSQSEREKGTETVQNTPKKPQKPSDSRAYAVLEAEKLGKLPVVQGLLDDYYANQQLINEGLVVRYQSTSEIGSEGNTALIGHRLTHGSVFKQVPEMKKGEKLTLTTTNGRYEYQVIAEARRTESSDNSPLYEPLGSGVDTKGRKLLTLITCGNWLTDHREVVVLELVQ